MLPHKPIQDFVKIISLLPGIGPRQALRLAYHLLHLSPKKQQEFIRTTQGLFSKMKLCSDCFLPFEPRSSKEKLCEICRDPSRDHSVICVVEKETDLLTIEKTKKYHGVYHILGGLYSGKKKKQGASFTLPQLIQRVKRYSRSTRPIREIILALNPTSEGNLTSYYIEKAIRNLNLNIKITRLARGIPSGGEIEFADSETLINALEGRK